MILRYWFESVANNIIGCTDDNKGNRINFLNLLFIARRKNQFHGLFSEQSRDEILGIEFLHIVDLIENDNLLDHRTFRENLPDFRKLEL